MLCFAHFTREPVQTDKTLQGLSKCPSNKEQSSRLYRFCYQHKIINMGISMRRGTLFLVLCSIALLVENSRIHAAKSMSMSSKSMSVSSQSMSMSSKTASTAKTRKSATTVTAPPTHPAESMGMSVSMSASSSSSSSMGKTAKTGSASSSPSVSMGSSSMGGSSSSGPGGGSSGGTPGLPDKLACKFN